MSFATSTQTKVIDFLRKLESSGSAARSFASISALKNAPAIGGGTGGATTHNKLFAKTEAVFRQGLLLGIQGHEQVLCKAGSVLPELMGVLCEGTAMGLAMLDLSTGWKKNERWRNFAEGDGERHIYEVYVGLGLAYAQMGQSPESKLMELEGFFKWLVMDGFGFHEGLFNTDRVIARKQASSKQFKNKYSSRAFDQGLGRSLWFIHNASASAIADSINEFAPARQKDLWSGIGIAAAHAGGMTREELSSLRELAGNGRAHLALGAAIAAKIREHAGTQTSHTDMACHVLCNLSAVKAADLTDKSQEDLPVDDAAQPSYEVWRQHIIQEFQ